MDEIYAKLKELLNKKIKRKSFDIDSLTPETTLESLGLDSLDAAELIITIEDEFSLPEVSQDEMMEIKTVKDLHDLIVSKKK
ncbi:MAG: acyl carrier protein [Eubacteriales bacterium]|nr:acyl carrier protein [Eubacteriales bacterium]